MSENTFKVGDRVRNANYRGVPTGAEGVVTDTSGAGSYPITVDWDSGQKRYLQSAYELELAPAPVEAPEKPRGFQVGDTVKLTGSGFDGDLPPRAGHTVKILETFGGDGGYGKIDVGTGGNRDVWYVYPAGTKHYQRWGADLVEAAVELDSTGYPEGTPRAEKHVPSTQAIKNTYAELGETDADKAALRAELNRWYEQELAEERVEGSILGFQEGYAQGVSEGYLAGLNAAAQGIVDNLLRGVRGVS
jgi:hypothetical protein